METLKAEHNRKRAAIVARDSRLARITDIRKNTRYLTNTTVKLVDPRASDGHRAPPISFVVFDIFSAFRATLSDRGARCQRFMQTPSPISGNIWFKFEVNPSNIGNVGKVFAVKC